VCGQAKVSDAGLPPLRDLRTCSRIPASIQDVSYMFPAVESEGGNSGRQKIELVIELVMGSWPAVLDEGRRDVVE
jgi:hypothetical protein